MILSKKIFNIKPIILTNLVFAFFPVSFIFGNLITNVNFLLFCCLGIFHLRTKILTTKFDFSVKLIFLFFFVVFFSSILSLFKSLYYEEYDYYNLVKLTKSIVFFRFFLVLVIIDLLSKLEILNFKYFFLSAAFVPIIASLDVIYQYIFGFDIIGLKSLGHYNSGFFGDELIAGGFILKFAFFSIIFLSFSFKNNLRFILITLAIIIFGLGILFSGNRMPLFLFFLGSFLFFLVNKKLKKILLSSFLILFVIFGFVSTIDSKIKNRYLSFLQNTNRILVYIFDHDNLSKLERSKKLHINKDKLKSKKDMNLMEANEENLSETDTLDVRKARKGIKQFAKRPLWEKGKLLVDDFEFGWALQNEQHSHSKLFLTALDTWGKNKIFGNGIKSFRKDCVELLLHTRNRLCSNHPHNYYLEILTETGIVGLLVILTIILLFIIFIFKNFKFLRKNNKVNLILLATAINLILEIFPLKSGGSFFSTGNAAYLILVISILLSHKKLSKI